jgi:IS5 family transposase
VNRLLEKQTLKTITADRGYRGLDQINGIIVQTPKPFNDKKQSKYKQKKLKRMFQKRAAIEPIIGHLKTDHRLGRNFYKGVFGDNTNIMLAAAAFNFKRMMRKWKTSFLDFLRQFVIAAIIIMMKDFSIQKILLEEKLAL